MAFPKDAALTSYCVMLKDGLTCTDSSSFIYKKVIL